MSFEIFKTPELAAQHLREPGESLEQVEQRIIPIAKLRESVASGIQTILVVLPFGAVLIQNPREEIDYSTDEKALEEEAIFRQKF